MTLDVLPGVLFNVTDFVNWVPIQQYGLRTAETLVHECLADPEERDRLLASPRPHSIAPLQHPALGAITLRDQGRLHLGALERSLDGSGMSTSDWCRLLNKFVFFFPGETRHLRDLLNAYRDRARLVLGLRTASLLRKYDNLMKVMTINTGAATYRGMTSRGPRPFVTATRYVGTRSRIQEVVIKSDVADAMEHLVGAWVIAAGAEDRVRLL